MASPHVTHTPGGACALQPGLQSGASSSTPHCAGCAAQTPAQPTVCSQAGLQHPVQTPPHSRPSALLPTPPSNTPPYQSGSGSGSRSRKCWLPSRGLHLAASAHMWYRPLWASLRSIQACTLHDPPHIVSVPVHRHVSRCTDHSML